MSLDENQRKTWKKPYNLIDNYDIPDRVQTLRNLLLEETLVWSHASRLFTREYVFFLRREKITATTRKPPSIVWRSWPYGGSWSKKILSYHSPTIVNSQQLLIRTRNWHAVVDSLRLFKIKYINSITIWQSKSLLWQYLYYDCKHQTENILYFASYFLSIIKM